MISGHTSALCYNVIFVLCKPYCMVIMGVDCSVVVGVLAVAAKTYRQVLIHRLLPLTVDKAPPAACNSSEAACTRN